MEEPSDRPPWEPAGSRARKQPSLPFPGPHSGSGSTGCCSLWLGFSNTCRIPRLHFLPFGRQLSPPSKKKDALRRQIVLPGPSLYKWSVSESETYGLHFPGKTLSSSKENLANGTGGGEAASAYPELSSTSQRCSAAPPLSVCLGVLPSAHPKPSPYTHGD